MTESLSDLEKDVEASRARLDRTIDRIQDRLSVPSLVDEMLGTARRTPMNGLYDGALVAVRQNPIPVMLIVAGVGLLLHRMSGEASRRSSRRRLDRDAERVPVLNTGAGRLYDPDQPTRRSGKELAEETQI